MKLTYLATLLFLCLTVFCKKSEPEVSQVPTIAKEALVGTYVFQELDWKSLGTAAPQLVLPDTSAESYAPSIACASIDLNRNEFQLLLPLSGEKLSFPLGEKFTYKEDTNYNQKAIGRIEFEVKSQGKTFSLTANDTGMIFGDFGNGVKTDVFAGKPFKSVEDCTAFPITMKKECKNGIKKGIVYIVSKDGSALRSSPSFEADSLENIPVGTGIQISDTPEGSGGQWSKTEFKGKSGFVYKGSYDPAPVCYNENTSLQKILDFTSLYTQPEIKFESNPISERLILKTIYHNRDKKANSFENKISKLPIDYEIWGSDVSSESFSIENVTFTANQIKLKIERTSYEYETTKIIGSDKIECYLDKEDILRFSPWNPKLSTPNCARL
ncbi:hypothetical protein [Leptospira wolffii]|uniref:hypothetical protein n=1 Tax=Leptospira wolffii TaxID=409998 RepID=UPI0002EF0AC4|nr:hypothetical protein [Leptospira wolffii]EPG67745.1 hypothetical protein LEP1GSC061_0981 [Leptospira wolffii serovar Khorat str. Khorat-H2]